MSQTIVITGTSSGLGKAMVHKFADRGWNVVATVRKDADLAVHDALPTVRTLLLDIDDEAAAEPFARDARDQFGAVDALVNNAGGTRIGSLEASTMEQIRRQYQTNVFGLISVTKAFIPWFREQRSGTIVNIASMTAQQGHPYASAYSSSKAAVVNLSEALSLELEEFGILVRVVVPGLHATQIFTKVQAADELPAYQSSLSALFARQAMAGSDPSVTADVVYRAVLDPDPASVHFYAGRDSAGVARAKVLLGESYWREYRASIAGTASSLYDALVPAAGTTPIPT